MVLQATDAAPNVGVVNSINAPGIDEWLLIEDNSLKQFLQGMTVADDANPSRPVKVWFGNPDPEVRRQSYPYLTIDLIDIGEDTERVMNAYAELRQPHRGFPVSDEKWVAKSMLPTPMNVVYQVASWSRQPRHDRSILAQMNFRYLHPRYAQMPSADDSARRIVVNEFAKADTEDENGKRLFRNVWTVTVKTEFFFYTLDLIPRVIAPIIPTVKPI